MGGKSAWSTRDYKQTSMFLCFHIRNYIKNTCLLVFSPFSAYFYPPMDKGLLGWHSPGMHRSPLQLPYSTKFSSDKIFTDQPLADFRKNKVCWSRSPISHAHFWRPLAQFVFTVSTMPWSAAWEKRKCLKHLFLVMHEVMVKLIHTGQAACWCLHSDGTA